MPNPTDQLVQPNIQHSTTSTEVETVTIPASWKSIAKQNFLLMSPLIWLFAPLMVLRLIKLSLSQTLGRLLGWIILPAQVHLNGNLPREGKLAAKIEDESKPFSYSSLHRNQTSGDPASIDAEIKHFYIKTRTFDLFKMLYKKLFGELWIEGFTYTPTTVPPTSTTLNSTAKIYIIYFPGNGAQASECISQMETDAAYCKQNNIPCEMIGFNYPGVGNSCTSRENPFVDNPPRTFSRYTPSQDVLIEAGIAMVQRLIAKGVKPEQIMCYGHSLGGGIATQVVKTLHELDQTVHLFNSRSFSSITNATVGLIRANVGIEPELVTGHQASTLGILLGYLAKPFIKLGLWLTNWEMNAAEAYNAIPSGFKHYVVARSSKSQRQGNQGDQKTKVSVPVGSQNPLVAHSSKSQTQSKPEEKTSVPIDDPVIMHYASLHQGIASPWILKKLKNLFIKPSIITLDQAEGIKVTIKKVLKKSSLAKPEAHNTPAAELSVRKLIDSTGNESSVPSNTDLTAAGFFHHCLAKMAKPESSTSTQKIDLTS